jgi:hypothetical protein
LRKPDLSTSPSGRNCTANDFGTKVKLRCGFCHPAKSLEKKNRCGRALEKEPGERNVDDRELIREALKKIQHLLPFLSKAGKD